ncbi:toprim domain-containing protein [Natronococcus occultus]|uniref:Uncharacterized protein n=1 Tax=Natronococcus occultus SP4 TaxID=694430 RepID=L0JZJ2_9EURY|nr:hypothetical protein [Natronococcus occultus]AGB38176.1 hypothetical protein Natoc_2401 [Natronococcus occultus SP4]
MGFFEKLGRKVGEFTHEAKEAAADEAPYVCEACGNQFYTDQPCPECGSERVTERETASDEADTEPAEQNEASSATDEDTEPTRDGTAPSTDPADDPERE